MSCNIVCSLVQLCLFEQNAPKFLSTQHHVRIGGQTKYWDCSGLLCFVSGNVLQVSAWCFIGISSFLIAGLLYHWSITSSGLVLSKLSIISRFILCITLWLMLLFFLPLPNYNLYLQTYPVTGSASTYHLKPNQAIFCHFVDQLFPQLQRLINGYLFLWLVHLSKSLI